MREVRMDKTDTRNSSDEYASQQNYIDWVKWGKSADF